MAFPNRYPGSCVNCSVRVDAGEGMTEKNKQGRYEVFCTAHAPAKPQQSYAPRAVVPPARPIPAGVKLFAHQVSGIDFLRVARAGKSAILADDMGLGKTAQTILSLPPDAPIVVICPSIAKGVWVREFAKFAPDVKTEVLVGRDSFRWPAANEAVITNFEILPKPVDGESGFPELEASLLETMPKGVIVVVDEAHKIKEWTSQRTKAARAISYAARKNDGRVWLLTGTPMLNRPTETYSLLVAAGLQYETFNGNRDEALTLGGGWKGRFEWEFHPSRVSPRFAESLRKVMLRRMKTEVLDLPPKRYEDIPVEIGRVKEADAALDALTERGVNLDDATTTLEKIGTNIPFELLSKAREALARAKTPAALALAESWVEDGEQVIVFSKHLAPVNACATLQGFRVIHQGVSAKQRAEIMDEFQSGKVRGIAATIDSAGVALTLTAATRELFVDKDWTPALNLQAEDRAQRIGQTKSVLISSLASDHELDRRIDELLAHKTALYVATIDAANRGANDKVEAPPAPVVEPVAAPAPVAAVVEVEDNFADLLF